MIRVVCAALLSVLPWGVTWGVTWADAPLPVVASFSILGDLVKNVGGDRVAVTTLVGPDGDTHAYTPRTGDARKLAAAKLIVVNGLDFERWIDRLIESADAKATRVVASKGVTPLMLPSAPTVADPHAWQAVSNAQIYVANIRDALIAADPVAKDIYTANAATYTTQLGALDRSIREGIATIPEAKRRAVTPHPSFGYFTAAYGVQFIAPQLPSNEAEASAKNIAAIIASIRRQNVSAVFLENIGDPRLMRQIASEAGAKLGGVLYTDALTTPDGPAPTYVALMQHNLRQIETALRD